MIGTDSWAKIVDGPPISRGSGQVTLPIGTDLPPYWTLVVESSIVVETSAQEIVRRINLFDDKEVLYGTPTRR